MKKNWWKTPLKVIGSILLAIFIFFGVYFLMVFLLGIIPVNQDFEPVDEGLSIYVLSNGVHTDIVVPTVTEHIDWRETFLPGDYRSAVDQAPYLGIGWGDKGFYLETPTWAELKPSVAFRAAFVPSPTAMHVTYHSQTPKTGERCRKIRISNGQYQQLINHIKTSFQRNDDNIILIPDKGYDQNDNFYEANGSYNMIQTCNMWVVKGLKKIGVRTAVWSPFDKGILYQLRAEKFY